LKYTGSGIAVLSGTIAVERNYTNAQGERETDFINYVAWRGTAETMSNFAYKGSLIGIEGSIQTRNYENNQNQTVHVTEVVVDNFQILEPKSVTDERRAQDGGGQPSQSKQQSQPKQDDNPFANVNFTDDPFENNEDDTDIGDDDLPF